MKFYFPKLSNSMKKIAFHLCKPLTAGLEWKTWILVLISSFNIL